MQLAVIFVRMYDPLAPKNRRGGVSDWTLEEAQEDAVDGGAEFSGAEFYA